MSEYDLLWIVICQGLAFWMGYRYGKHITVMRIVKNLVDNPDNLNRFLAEYRALQRRWATEESADAGKSDSVGRLNVERHGDQLYIYDRENDQFLAQGHTLQECLDLIAKRFPDRNYAGLLTAEQAEALGIKDK